MSKAHCEFAFPLHPYPRNLLSVATMPWWAMHVHVAIDIPSGTLGAVARLASAGRSCPTRSRVAYCFVSATEGQKSDFFALAHVNTHLHRHKFSFIAAERCPVGRGYSPPTYSTAAPYRVSTRLSSAHNKTRSSPYQPAPQRRQPLRPSWPGCSSSQVKSSVRHLLSWRATGALQGRSHWTTSSITSAL
ncbi:hypothetical protein BJV78DRAFT_273656 [Lactifluus subvellereus]|nr:hypothetical protein BJV78DRAFT_273656 [Lactifluus subvellereus]